MRLPLPGPTAVLGSAVAAAEAVETAIGLVPRMAAALTRVEAILDRVDAVVDKAEAVVDSADQATVRTHATLDRADVVTTVAARQSDAAAGVLDRIDTALLTWEPTLRRLAPSAERFAETLEKHEVDAAIALVDRLPALLEHMENDVLPVLTRLDRVGPDLHELLAVVEDLRRVITGLPGVGLLRRRGDDEPPTD
jgi:ABC-type transporter Mla subunit MlaD